MKILVKVGGTLLETGEARDAIARQLAAVAATHDLLVVHGGGKQVTRYLEDRGLASRFVNGLRVSDAAVIDALLKVVAGDVNKQLVSALRAAGVSAFGLSGVDGGLTRAVPLDPDLGYVGAAAYTDARLLALLRNAGYVPVVACLAADADGTIYNVNADEMAASCAVAWKAETLLFLTDVPGIKDTENRVISHLTPCQARELIHSGIVHGGMQAKLQASLSAVKQGVSEVRIASGVEQGICGRLLAAEPLGTRLSRENSTQLPGIHG